MNQSRLDGWSEDEERLLADLVISSIRKGGTQLAAFQEAAEKLKRTHTACGHRWNRVLRKKYTAQLEEAKTYWRLNQRERKDLQDISEFRKNDSTNIDSLSNLAHTPHDYKLVIEIALLRQELIELTHVLSTIRKETHFFLCIFKQSLAQFLQETQSYGEKD